MIEKKTNKKIYFSSKIIASKSGNIKKTPGIGHQCNVK